MLKTHLMLASLTAIALAVPAAAQEQARTRTYEGPRSTGTQTITVNRDTGTATRDREVTNRTSGATSSSSAVRQRTETSSTISVVQTGPQCRSRSLEGERTRTETGSTFTGTATDARGQTYGLSGSRSRDGLGNSAASQSVTNGAGETLVSRERITTRSDGQVNTAASRSRAKGLTRPPRTRRPRGWLSLILISAGKAPPALPAASASLRTFVVADHFVDDEAQEFLGKLRIEIGFFREHAKPRDLPRRAGRGGGGKRRLCLVFAHRLSDPEPLGQDVDQRCIDVVNALAERSEYGIGCVGSLRILRHRTRN